MPDYWSVPLNTAGIDDLDSTIAKGPDLSFIGNLANSYFQGKDQAYTQAQRDIFKNGVPADLGSQLLKTGGIAQVPNYISLLRLQQAQGIQNQANNSGIYGDGSIPSAPSSALMPPSSATAVPNKPVQVASVQPNIASDVPTGTPMPPGQNITGPNSTVSRVDYGPVQSGPMPAQPVQVAQNAPASGDITAQRIQRLNYLAGEAMRMADAAAAGGNNDLAQNLRARAQQFSDQAKIVLGTLADNAKTTPEQKNAASSGQPSPLDYNTAKTEQETQVKDLQKLADTGIESKGKIGQLNTIEQLGAKVGYGVVPQLQSLLGKYGVNTQGLSDIQALERAIDFMAPQLRPVGSGRLMQAELTAFKSALGGLMTTPEGRKISIENLKLINNYAAQVGGIASDTSKPAAQRYREIYSLEPPKLNLEVPKGGQAANKPGGVTSSGIKWSIQ